MSEHDTGRAAVDADFAGGRRRFCLRLGEMGEIERLTGHGIGAIYARLSDGRFGSSEVWDVIRLGLKGGGMSDAEAAALVAAHRGRPLMDAALLAIRVVAAAVSGMPSVARERGARDRRPGDLSVFYAGGAVIGWNPRDVDRLTLAEFGAAINGWMAAHASRENVDVTEDEFARVLAEEMAAGRA